MFWRALTAAARARLQAARHAAASTYAVGSRRRCRGVGGAAAPAAGTGAIAAARGGLSFWLQISKGVQSKSIYSALQS